MDVVFAMRNKLYTMKLLWLLFKCEAEAGEAGEVGGGEGLPGSGQISSFGLGPSL